MGKVLLTVQVYSIGVMDDSNTGPELISYSDVRNIVYSFIRQMIRINHKAVVEVGNYQAFKYLILLFYIIYSFWLEMIKIYL